MIDYRKKYIRHIRLNSFHPLCETAIGLRAIETKNYAPFIDASCRREPDFESNYPSISCLCRQEEFAPLPQPNDIVVYITVKSKWRTDFEHYRLVAILEVMEHKMSHAAGAAWYRSRGESLPSNCMVPDNPPHEFDETRDNLERNPMKSAFSPIPLKSKNFSGKGGWKNGTGSTRQRQESGVILSSPSRSGVTTPIRRF